MGHMREWCVVLDADSQRAARKVGSHLRHEGASVDDSRGRVWCFTTDEQQARLLATRAVELTITRPLICDPIVRYWDEELHIYIDPEHPDEEWVWSDVKPGDVRWRVRLELASRHTSRRLRPQILALGHPVIRKRRHSIDLGTRDSGEAFRLASRASALEGVVAANPSEIRGRIRGWAVRQRLGNYATDPTGSRAGYVYPDVSWPDDRSYSEPSGQG
jgi:hypothetical protein